MLNVKPLQKGIIGSGEAKGRACRAQHDHESSTIKFFILKESEKNYLLQQLNVLQSKAEWYLPPVCFREGGAELSQGVIMAVLHNYSKTEPYEEETCKIC